MRRIKTAFDPHGILNPGTIFDEIGFDEIGFDENGTER
jgi:hypothetical protein